MIVRGPRVVRCELPLQPGRERRAAAAHQLARLHLGDHLGRRHRVQRLAQRGHAALGAVVVEAGGVHHADVRQRDLDQPTGPQLGRGRLAVQQGFRVGRRVAIQVDQGRGRAVAQPQAAHRLQGVGAVGRGFAGTDAQPLGQARHQRIGPSDSARAVLADADHLPTDRLGVEHLVEFGDTINVRQRDREEPGDPLDGRPRQPAAAERLRVVEDFQEACPERDRRGHPAARRVAGQHGIQSGLFDQRRRFRAGKTGVAYCLHVGLLHRG